MPRATEVAAERAEVTHPPTVPQERMSGLVAGEGALADDLAAVVEPGGEGGGAAERAEVAHPTARPQVRVDGRRARRGVGRRVGVGVAGYLSPCVERGRD